MPSWAVEDQPPVRIEVGGAAFDDTIARERDPDVLVERGAASAVLVHERVRRAREHAEGDPQAPHHVAEQHGPVDRVPGQCQRRGGRDGQLVGRLVDVDPDPDHDHGRPGVDALHQDPAHLAIADHHVVGPLQGGETPEGTGDGVPGHERDHGPPLGVDDRVEDGRERQRRSAWRHPLAVEPSTALLLVVGDHDPVADRVGSSQCVGRAGLGVQAHLPLRAGHRLEGDLVERRPSEGGGVHGTRLAWQTRGGHT